MQLEDAVNLLIGDKASSKGTIMVQDL